MSTLTLLHFARFACGALSFCAFAWLTSPENHKKSNDVNCSPNRSHCTLKSQKKTKFAFKFATSCAIVLASVTAFTFARTSREYPLICA